MNRHPTRAVGLSTRAERRSRDAEGRDLEAGLPVPKPSGEAATAKAAIARVLGCLSPSRAAKPRRRRRAISRVLGAYPQAERRSRDGEGRDLECWAAYPQAERRSRDVEGRDLEAGLP